MRELLSVKAIDGFYGDLQVLWGVSLAVEEKTVTALIGSNGSGKSTLLKSIVGLVRVRTGTISFCGERIDHLRPYEIASMGISMVPEGRRLFPQMTVFENLELGAYVRSARGHVNQNLKLVFDLFPSLRKLQHQRAELLSGGQQQMLAIGRALMAMPRLLVLDEPSLGLMPILSQAIFQVINDTRAQGVTVLLIEQNVGETLAISDYYYTLSAGRITHAGLCKDFIKHEELRKAYLGL